jgi:hypothetical protein
LRAAVRRRPAARVNTEIVVSRNLLTNDSLQLVRRREKAPGEVRSVTSRPGRSSLDDLDLVVGQRLKILPGLGLGIAWIWSLPTVTSSLSTL